MWLQLDTPPWTAMALALPTRGQFGIKGLWRAAGTILGAIAAVVAIALFAQRPIALGIVVAAWCDLNPIWAAGCPVSPSTVRRCPASPRRSWSA
jgi:hypothetical protein